MMTEQKLLEQLKQANQENEELKEKIRKLDAELDYWCANGILFTFVEKLHYQRKKDERLAAERKAKREAQKSQMEKLESELSAAGEKGDKNNEKD